MNPIKTKAIMFMYVVCLSLIPVVMSLFVGLKSHVRHTTLKIPRHIQYSFTIHNKTNRVVEEGVVMPRIARMMVKGEPTVYHVVSRTALKGFVLGDLEKEYLNIHRKDAKTFDMRS